MYYANIQLNRVYNVHVTFFSRSKFDIIWRASDQFRVISQAFVSCNFCGKSIACNMPVASRARPHNSYSAGTLTSTKPKVMIHLQSLILQQIQY